MTAAIMQGGSYSMYLSTKLYCGFAIAASLLPAWAIGPIKAYADVSVTYTVNVTGMPTRTGGTPTKFPVTLKSYFTSTKARVEGLNGAVTIYDIAGGQTYVLDTAKKTYYIQTANSGGRFNMDATANLTPTTVTKTIKTITATKYTLDGTVTMPNFGGNMTPPTLNGEVWFSDSAQLPDGATSATPEAAIFTLNNPMFGKSLSTELMKVKRIPISGKITFAATFPSFNGGTPTSINIFESFFADTITNGAISDDLLTVPSTYTKVDPPQRNWGRGPGGGGPGGPGGGAPPAPNGN
jgi:hypothetical protein